MKLVIRHFIGHSPSSAFVSSHLLFPKFSRLILGFTVLSVLLRSVSSIAGGIVGRSKYLLLINDFVIYQLSVVLQRELNVIVNVELNLGSAGSDQFHLLLIVEFREILMLENFFNGQSLGWIKLKQSADEVQALRTDLGPEEVCFILSLLCVEKLKDVMSQVQVQSFEVLRARRPRPGDYFLDLVDGGSSWEQGLAVEHLTDQTAQSPHVDLFVVIFRPQQELRCPVPSGSNIIGHDDELLVGRLFHEPHQAEVAQFGLAVLVDQNIRRLYISMDEVRVMQVIDRLGHLINYVLLVSLLQLGASAIFADESVQIDVHMLEYQVDVLVVSRPDHLLQPDDIGVPQLSQEHYLTVCPLGIC